MDDDKQFPVDLPDSYQADFVPDFWGMAVAAVAVIAAFALAVIVLLSWAIV